MWYDDADLMGVVSRTAAPGLPDRKCARRCEKMRLRTGPRR